MDVVEKSWEIQRRAEEKARHVGKGKYGRVLRMARKPTNEEYIRILQITALGALLIGGLGFLIWLIMTQVAPGALSALFG
jgi:protein transport protein SEC61 subunit gamma-like protein